ncbi:MAG: ATP-binding domain-containing protein [Nitriliruptorales bacterium]
MRGTVTRVDPDHEQLWFQPDQLPLPLRLPRPYLEGGWVDHAYAITAHKAQGLTCDATFVLGDESIYREWGYVALSRGRNANHLYVDGDGVDAAEEFLHQAALEANDDNPVAALRRRLHRSQAEVLGLDQLDRSAVGESRRRIEQSRARELERGFDTGLGL